MVLSHTYASLYKLILLIGLPLVNFYISISDNPFLCVDNTDSNLVERWGNVLLVPTQYLFVGKKAYPTQDPDIPYEFQNKFDYNSNWALKTIASAAFLVPSITWGSIIKGTSYLFEDTRTRHQNIKKSYASQAIRPNNEQYRALGIPINIDFKTAKPAKTHTFPRSPKDQNNLHEDKIALKDIVTILEKNNIPYWVDCGTCLGTYRHEGVIPWDNDIDIAVLEPDFENIKRALNKLDPEKYIVFDWSSRDKPKTYLKVHVKNSDILIDLYHYRIDPENNTLGYILSNEDNLFLSESWRARERHYKIPVSFDLIFPLKRARFDGIDVLVPNKMEEYLMVRYGQNLSPAMVYNPETDKYEKDEFHPYWQLEEK